MPKLGLHLGITSSVNSNSTPAEPQIWKVAVFGAGQFINEEEGNYDLNMEYLWDGVELDDGLPVYHGFFGVGPDGFHPDLRHYDGYWHLRLDGNSIYTTPSLTSPDWSRDDSNYPLAPQGNAVSYDQNSFISSLYFPDGQNDFSDETFSRSTGGDTGFEGSAASLQWSGTAWEGISGENVLFSSPDLFHFNPTPPTFAVIGYNA